MSLEMAHKVILPPKKNYIPQFLKQRDINSYYVPEAYLVSHTLYISLLIFISIQLSAFDGDKSIICPLKGMALKIETFWALKWQQAGGG